MRRWSRRRRLRVSGGPCAGLSTVAEEVLGEIADALVVRPGDGLIVRVLPSITMNEVEYLRTTLLERLPDVEVTIIAAEQLAVVRRG